MNGGRKALWVFPGRGGGPVRGHFPGLPTAKAKDFKGTAQRLLMYLKPYRLQLGTVFLSAVLGALFSILTPKVMGLATTRMFDGLMMKLHGVPGAGIDFGYVYKILLDLAILYLLSAGLNYVQHYLMAGVAQKIVYDMRSHVNDKLSRLPLRFFDSLPHGEVLSRVSNDIDNISTTLQQSMMQLITAVVTLAGIVTMMLVISPLMTIIAAVTLPLSFTATAVVARRSQRYFAAQQKALGELNGHVEEMYGGHMVVKAFGQEKRAVEKFEAINGRLYDAGWKAQFVSGLIMPILDFINNAGYVFICVAGAILVAGGRMAIGDMQAFIQYSRRFTQPVIQTANIANVLQSTVASAERVFEILDEEEETPDAGAVKKIESPEGEIEFRNVRFSYLPGVPLIENMSFKVKKGQTVAIVGPTGAGKTTLVNLLMRFYEISGGSIFIDGVDIRDIRREDLRGIFGMVLQDAWLFSGTVRENIAYGREGATFDEIVRAARAAHADHFIRTLPDGYNTVINEEASNISQGQKQLLTIARAFLAEPAVLILDEATSSVDTRTEILIQKAMASLMKGRTSFVIAHRLSTIRDADLILVMNSGRVIEQGTHRELLAKGGFYAELYNSQFAVLDGTVS